MRPGWGMRHPALAEVLRTAVPLATVETTWVGGELPLRVCAYAPLVDLPDDIVTSVRCIVVVGECVVVCTNVHGSHPWPGGRRELGESYADTAAREVHEETGWRIDRGSIRELGWLHFESLTEHPDNHPWPHPDFLQVVVAAAAVERDGGTDGSWTDTEGYEEISRLVRIEDVSSFLSGDASDLISSSFLAILRAGA